MALQRSSVTVTVLSLILKNIFWGLDVAKSNYFFPFKSYIQKYQAITFTPPCMSCIDNRRRY